MCVRFSPATEEMERGKAGGDEAKVIGALTEIYTYLFFEVLFAWKLWNVELRWSFMFRVFINEMSKTGAQQAPGVCVYAAFRRLVCPLPL